MASHSSTLAWKIPWMEEPGRLQSMGSLRVRHDWATSLSLFTFLHRRGKRQPTPVLLPGESQGRGSLVAAVYGVIQSQTRLKGLSSSSSSWLSGKESACQWRRYGFDPGSSGEGNGNPFQYPCLGNPMDRGAWWATVHQVAESQTRLSSTWRWTKWNTGANCWYSGGRVSRRRVSRQRELYMQSPEAGVWLDPGEGWWNWSRFFSTTV